MHEIQQSLQEVTGLISLPEVYLKVQQLMDDPTSDIYDFAEVISVDPNLATRVLKVVNSAYFGFPEPVDSISRAVNMIGIGQLHNMVLGISAMSSLELPNDILPLNAFWRSSIYSGVLARLLAEHMKLTRADRLFIAGLLHEIGHLVLYSRFPEQALAAQRIAREQGKQIHEAELQVIGYHYGEIGAMLMENWNLSGQLQEITRYQPVPVAATGQVVETAVMHLAHACAQSVASDHQTTAEDLLDENIRELTGLTQEALEQAMEEARSISADMEKVILA